MSGCVSGNKPSVGSEGDLLALQEVLLSLLVCVHTCSQHPPLASPHIRSRISSLASLAPRGHYASCCHHKAKAQRFNFCRWFHV